MGFFYHFYKGTALIRRSNSKEGMPYLLEAMQQARRQADTSLILRCLTSIEIAHSSYQDSSAMPYLREHEMLARLVNDTLDMIVSHLNFAAIYNNFLADKAASIRHFLIAEKLALQSSKKSLMGEILLFYGGYMDNLNKRDSAIHYMHRAKELFSKEGKQYYTAITYFNLASLLANAKGEYSPASLYKARRYCDSALAVIDRDNDFYLHILEKKTELLEKSGAQNELVGHLIHYNREYKRLTLKNNKESAILAKSFDSAKLNATEIRLLKEKQNAYQLKINNRTLVLILAAVLLLLAISYFIYSARANARRNKRLQAEIRDRELELASQLRDFEQEQKIKYLTAYTHGQREMQHEIGRELHDTIAASMAGLKFKIEAQAAGRPDNQLLTAEIVSMYNRVRDLSHNLIENKDAIEFSDGFINTIRQFIFNYFSSTAVNTHFQTDGDDGWDRLPGKSKISLFSIVSEVLANAVRHAEPTDFFTELSYHKNTYLLCFTNNGVKPVNPAGKNSNGTGMTNIRMKTDALGGRLETNHDEEKGEFSVILKFEYSGH